MFENDLARRYPTDEQQRSFKTMVDLGKSFYMQTKVPDTSSIYVSVGLGFHAQ